MSHTDKDVRDEILETSRINDVYDRVSEESLTPATKPIVYETYFMDKRIEDIFWLLTENENLLTFISDEENVIFDYSNKLYPLSRSILSIVSHNKSAIVYECNKIINPTIEEKDGQSKVVVPAIKSNDYVDIPYIQLRHIGIPSGIVPLSHIKHIINNKQLKIIKIVPLFVSSRKKATMSTVSLQMLLPTRNPIGALHCQSNTNESVYTLLPLKEKTQRGGTKIKKSNCRRKQLRKTNKNIKGY